MSASGSRCARCAGARGQGGGEARRRRRLVLVLGPGLGRGIARRAGAAPHQRPDGHQPRDQLLVGVLHRLVVAPALVACMLALGRVPPAPAAAACVAGAKAERGGARGARRGPRARCLRPTAITRPPAPAVRSAAPAAGCGAPGMRGAPPHLGPGTWAGPRSRGRPCRPRPAGSLACRRAPCSPRRPRRPRRPDPTSRAAAAAAGAPAIGCCCCEWRARTGDGALARRSSPSSAARRLPEISGGFWSEWQLLRVGHHGDARRALAGGMATSTAAAAGRFCCANTSTPARSVVVGQPGE
jgi:hypothetical protein